MKQCVLCNRVLALACFSRAKLMRDKLSNRCKKCHAAYERARRLAKGVVKSLKRLRDPKHITLGLKECFQCDKLSPLEDFSPCDRGYGGVAAYCRECQNKRSRHSRADGSHAEYIKKWRQGNQKWRMQHAGHQARRRAQKQKSDTGLVTTAFILGLYSTTHCFYCDKFTEVINRTMDHMIPLSRGGLHDPLNLVMACGRCNFSKHSMTAEEYFVRLVNDK